MFRDGSALATRHEPFAPRVIALDPVLDSLDVFASERRPDARSGSRPAPARRVEQDRPLVVTLRAPQRMVALVAAISGSTLLAVVVVSAVIAAPAAPPAPRTGTITITSEPSGVPVFVDGVARGATPFAAALTAGTHAMDIGVAGRIRRRVVQVSPGGVFSVHVEWPVETLTVPVTDTPVPREPSTASPGDADAVPTPSTHRLVLVNNALDFQEEREVTIAARRGVTLSLDTRRGTLRANAQPQAGLGVALQP